MRALDALKAFKSGDLSVLKKEKWLLYIGITEEININLERVASLKDAKNNYVLDYVERTLMELEKVEVSQYSRHIVEEVLKWCEVSKAGLPHKRLEWKSKGYNLFVHNIGSAQIFMEHAGTDDYPEADIIYEFIKTHGLIGQYLRGEVTLKENLPLVKLLERNRLSVKTFKEITEVLNYCVISAVSEELWKKVEVKVNNVAVSLAKGDFSMEYDLKERLRALRKISIKNGEDFEKEYRKYLQDEQIYKLINRLLLNVQLWYVEAALYDFSFEEFIKVLLILSTRLNVDKIRHISFEEFMKEIYYEHEGTKRVNIYKKRIIEKYLLNHSVEDILNSRYWDNIHVKHTMDYKSEFQETVFFTFSFSAAGSKLIDFCTEAEKSDVLYEKAIVLLFDFFELRKDKYDRFYEEEEYLRTMNSTIDYKKIILDYIIGDTVIDIGPGGGALMDIIEKRYPDKRIIGVDISQNVIESLSKKKLLENHNWEVMYGDALNLTDYMEKGSVDTIIFCSILHELFSYIEYDGEKFNHATLAAALRSAFDVISQGGRIIIRDGIMTEPVGEKRIIKFLSEEGMEFLKRYTSDFIGRQIQFHTIGRNEVIMPVNDAMEFLYTYTWGEKSYVHEVNEQFGYFTPSGFLEFVRRELGERAHIIEWRHFLQEGYTVALSQKVQIFDEERNSISLPDSNCFMVIEKLK